MTVEAHPRGGSLLPLPDAWFEDYAVGQHVTTGPRPVGKWQLVPHGGAPRPFPGLTFLGVVSQSGVLPGSLLRVLDTEWRELGPLRSDDTVEAFFTVTRCRRVPDEAAGSVRWHVLVRDDGGRAL
ncbi:MAG: hypothetical protein M3Q22_09175, partial [Actinomycetota bacterium]|nr:hypothetical protein [Actinomycetota bacterium]